MISRIFKFTGIFLLIFLCKFSLLAENKSTKMVESQAANDTCSREPQAKSGICSWPVIFEFCEAKTSNQIGTLEAIGAVVLYHITLFQEAQIKSLKKTEGKQLNVGSIGDLFTVFIYMILPKVNSAWNKLGLLSRLNLPGMLSWASQKFRKKTV